MMPTEDIIRKLRSRVGEDNFDHIVAERLELAFARIRQLEKELEYYKKLHELAERAMNSAYEASRGFEKLAQKSFDECERLHSMFEGKIQ